MKFTHLIQTHTISQIKYEVFQRIFMDAYIRYKAWWIQHESPHKVGTLYWGETAEECFEQHVKDIGLYRLMETLVDWNDEK